jgi:hypothetical protein
MWPGRTLPVSLLMNAVMEMLSGRAGSLRMLIDMPARAERFHRASSVALSEMEISRTRKLCC